MKKYLVTGGAGFIGSHIAGRLLQAGNFVRVADNFSTGKKEHIKAFLRQPNFELFKGDLANAHFADKAVNNMQVVFHQAAAASVAGSIENPLHAHHANITGTLNLLLAAKKAGVKKFVFASSSSVYGNNPESPKKETFAIDPVSPYALTKYAGEKYTQLFWELYGLPTVCLRYFNVFGPKQDPYSQYSAVIPKFITSFLKNQKPVIYGNGEQSRDFVYIDNVVDANILAAKATTGYGQVFNVGCGASIDLNQVIVLLQKITGKNIKPVYQKARKGDIVSSTADIAKASNILRYAPAVHCEEGLKKTVEWYQQYG